MPLRPRIWPPVGKSGPGIRAVSSRSESSGLAIMAKRPLINSPGLWGGMLVAIPTAMPEEPLSSNWGNRAGSTVGSCWLPSKLSAKSTVSLSISSRSASVVSDCSRDSVYRIAAGGSLSTEPKLPWPSMSGMRIEKSWAIRTRASYTAVSPWGWYLPSTSPTTRAHFR